MKKLFLAICFIVLTGGNLQAKVQEVLDINNIPKVQQNTGGTPKVTEISAEGLGEFLMERLRSTVVQDPKDIKSEAIYVVPSDTAVDNNEEEKGTFKKIYDEAMKRATAGEQFSGQREDLTEMTPDMAATHSRQQQEWDMPDFPVINALLPPHNRREMIPAREHIPYLMTNIEILSNGMIKFTETVTVVANGEKLRYGLTKALPKHIYSRRNERQKIDYSLIGVTVNNQPIDYKIVEQGERILFIPKEEYELEPGVYTYQFRYVSANALWDYQDFREFYWDINGSVWNLVVARAGATVTLPPAVTPLGQEFYAGYPQELRGDLITMVRENDSTWGFAAKNPLFIGEGFHLIFSLPEDAVTPPRWDQRLTEKIVSRADVLFSLAGLLAIWLSFKISWKYIKASKGQLKINLRKNGILLRYLAFNKFDLASFGSFLLELYRKNIIDIQQAEDTILLIKRTDNLSSLSKAEKKAVAQLFTGNEAVLNVNKSNFLKIRRAAAFLEKELHRKLSLYVLKRNSGYLFFSLGMLVLSELFIAALQINILRFWLLELLSTAVILAGIIIFNIKMLKLYGKIIMRILGVITGMCGFAMLSGIVSPPAAFLVTLSLLTIVYYTSGYAQRNGLLRTQIKETQDLRATLLGRKENLLLGRDIVNQQANILALDLVDDFKDGGKGNEYFKLDAIQALINKLRA